jgi:hypothetical protein
MQPAAEPRRADAAGPRKLVKSILLRGRESEEIGAVTESRVDEIAAALSRGGAPKRYQYVDPNEDAALSARGERGVLVAVADGHWGHLAAERALEALLAEASEWLDGAARSADTWYQTALTAVVAINDAVLAARTGGERSRTTLSFALARPAENLLIHASLGDSHLFVVDQIVASEISRPRKPTFIGSRALRASEADKVGRIGVQPLDAPRAIVAATDGLSEHAIGVEDPAGAVYSAVDAASRAVPADRSLAATRTLVETALAAHREHAAGDNLAVAIAWLGA